MPISLINPKLWKLPDPKKVIEALDNIKKRNGAAQRTFSSDISPVDLYAYLKARFGNPNGFMMTLKAPTADNLVHWQFTLESPDTIFDVNGENMRTTVWLYSIKPSDDDWASFERVLKTEIADNKRVVEETKRGFEKWGLFVNPYKRLLTIVNRCEARLKEIKVPEAPSVPNPATNEQIVKYKNDLGEASIAYQEVKELCVTLDMVVPVLGEAFVNFLVLVMGKSEVRNDQRMRESFTRQPIDVRVKSLSLVCDGFEKPIDGSEEPFKRFLRVMNQRNDSLHGNIDPSKTVGEEIYFDLRTIPLLKSARTFGEHALKSALEELTPKSALEKVTCVREFIDFLLLCLEPELRPMVVQAMHALELGYRADTKKIGVILPDSEIDSYMMVNVVTNI